METEATILKKIIESEQPLPAEFFPMAEIRRVLSWYDIFREPMKGSLEFKRWTDGGLAIATSCNGIVVRYAVPGKSGRPLGYAEPVDLGRAKEKCEELPTRLLWGGQFWTGMGVYTGDMNSKHWELIQQHGPESIRYSHCRSQEKGWDNATSIYRGEERVSWNSRELDRRSLYYQLHDLRGAEDHATIGEKSHRVYSWWHPVCQDGKLLVGLPVQEFLEALKEWNSTGYTYIKIPIRNTQMYPLRNLSGKRYTSFQRDPKGKAVRLESLGGGASTNMVFCISMMNDLGGILREWQKDDSLAIEQVMLCKGFDYTCFVMFRTDRSVSLNYGRSPYYDYS